MQRQPNPFEVRYLVHHYKYREAVVSVWCMSPRLLFCVKYYCGCAPNGVWVVPTLTTLLLLLLTSFTVWQKETPSTRNGNLGSWLCSFQER